MTLRLPSSLVLSGAGLFASSLLVSIAAFLAGHTDVRDVSLVLALGVLVIAGLHYGASQASAQPEHVVCDDCRTSVPLATTAVCADGRRRCVACPGRVA